MTRTIGIMTDEDYMLEAFANIKLATKYADTYYELIKESDSQHFTCRFDCDSAAWDYRFDAGSLVFNAQCSARMIRDTKTRALVVSMADAINNLF